MNFSNIVLTIASVLGAVFFVLILSGNFIFAAVIFAIALCFGIAFAQLEKKRDDKIFEEDRNLY